jgi:hypothetical protein
VYGHVDLDNICEHDYFPEEEPKPPKDVDEAGLAALDPAYLAWQERERLWQPRTYRALLEGTKYTVGPHRGPEDQGLLRELVPFKEAQALLKKRGIDLPSYYNRKRPADLVRLMRIRDALHESPWLDKPKALNALASATGVNLAAIQKQLAKEHAAKGTV